MDIYVDSDVVISSLLSSNGATYLLLHQSNLSLFVSSVQKKELLLVCQRLTIKEKNLNNLFNHELKIIPLKEPIGVTKKKYNKYVRDSNDSHIVAAAHKAGVRFLITYNLKHFVIDAIKQDFGIQILTPGLFLQYLRSLV